MRRTIVTIILALALAIWLAASGVTPAFIPASVPASAKRGNGTRFQLADAAAVTSGNCAKFDANGNVADNGVPCAGGGTTQRVITVSLSGGAGTIATGNTGLY